MGIRDLVATSWGIPAADAMRALNARHPWNHNDHFHAWILAHLPAERRAALDVGCGRGALLAELAPYFEDVHGVDRDEGMRRAAAGRCIDLPNVRVDATDLADVPGPVDLVTMVAVLHHLDLDAALRDVRRVLAPGGKLLVVALTVPVTARDHAWDVASMVTNPVIGALRSPWPRPPSGTGGPFAPIPVRDPVLSLDEIAEVARVEMPGARLRHHLGFRSTLEWEKPRDGSRAASPPDDRPVSPRR